MIERVLRGPLHCDQRMDLDHFERVFAAMAHVGCIGGQRQVMLNADIQRKHLSSRGSGEPGSAPKCTMAITGFLVLNSLSNLPGIPVSPICFGRGFFLPNW
jgi:hypothetical protein